MAPSKRKRILEKMGLPAVTPWTVTDEEKLEREFSFILERGYATEDQELMKGVRRVAAPIHDHSGRVAGCLSVGAPVFRLEPPDFDELGVIVKGTADQISERLGASTE
jgi:DNA-binding IclR family transcriptional regulator